MEMRYILQVLKRNIHEARGFRECLHDYIYVKASSWT